MKRLPDERSTSKDFFKLANDIELHFASITNEDMVNRGRRSVKTFFRTRVMRFSAVLDEPEREALDFGYRERVTDMH